MKEHGHEHNDEHRRGILQDDGGSGGGQFVGVHIQGTGGAHHGTAEQNRPVEDQLVSPQFHIQKDDNPGDEGACAVDGHGPPGDGFDDNAAQREAHGFREDQQGGEVSFFAHGFFVPF